MVSALRIKLKFLEFPSEGLQIYSVTMNTYIKNVSNPESKLNKKHNAINYHVCREAVAAGIISGVKEDTHTNPSDAFTKLIPYGKKQGLPGGIIWGY